MKSQKRPFITLIALLTLLLNSSVAGAQDSNPQVKKELTSEFEYQLEMNFRAASTFKFFESKAFGKVIKGAPYSATAVTEHVQTLGDGNQIIRKNEAKIYRDSEGRVRREQKLETIGKWTAAGEAPQFISITDPVAGLAYNLDPRTRTARTVITGPFKWATDSANEKVQQQLENQLKRREEALSKRKEQEHEREEKLNEQAREREERLKRQAQEREERLKEREKEYREKSKEQEKQYKEMSKERIKQGEERAKEQEERAKEREEQYKEQEKERAQHLKERNEEMKAREQEMKEHKERVKTIEKQHKEIDKQIKFQEKKFIESSTLKKEIADAQDNRKIEALGKQTIEGVEAEGKRSTRIIPVGEIGNIRPLEIIDESWYSADLQVQVMTKHSDPRSGVTTYRLTRINRHEPERSLFAIPADYTVVDERINKKRMTKPSAPDKPTTPGSPSEPANKPEPPKKPKPERSI